jgi:hypothetical protein
VYLSNHTPQLNRAAKQLNSYKPEKNQLGQRHFSLSTFFIPVKNLACAKLYAGQFLHVWQRKRQPAWQSNSSCYQVAPRWQKGFFWQAATQIPTNQL